MWTFIASSLSLACGILLMFVILLQRGRGGGLAGAFGGLGGQSAFGTKAGDVFTRITIVLAVVWVVLNAATIYAMRFESEGRFVNPDAKAVQPGGEMDVKGTGTADDLPIESAKPSADKKDDASATKNADDKGPTLAPEKSATDSKTEGTSPATDSKPAPEGAAASDAKTESAAPDAPKAPAEPPKEAGK